jgi:hypothetical protein
MGFLGRKGLLEKEALKIEKVVLDKINHVFVRQMTGREKDRWEQSLTVGIRNKKGVIERYEQNLEDFRAKLAVETLCDEKGVLLLQTEDFAILSQNMSAATLDKIVKKAQRLNKISDEDKDGLVKNSEGAQSADSTSGSAKS